MLAHLLRHLQERRVPQPAVAELAALAELVNQLVAQVSVLAGSLVGFETVLTHHGLLTPEVLEIVKKTMQEKFAARPDAE